MATRKNTAAEAELQRAEAEYVKLHPLASQGNDVSPVTRGELRIILEDLLTQLGKAAPVEAPKAAAASSGDATGHKVDTTGFEQFMPLGIDGIKDFAKQNNIDVSALDGQSDLQLWAEFVAAAMNAGA
jgi:hypothetical protein